MGWLSRLVGLEEPQKRMEVDAIVLEGDELVAAVGESNYQHTLRSACGSVRWEDVAYDCLAVLVPQPSNRHDPNAVMVQVDGQLVGYLSRGDAADYGPAFQTAAAMGKVIACEARIAGRGPGSDTDNLGIFLHLPGPDEALLDVAE